MKLSNLSVSKIVAMRKIAYKKPSKTTKRTSTTIERGFLRE